VRRIFNESPFREHCRGELLPGTKFQTDAELTEYLRENAQSMYHPVGTCRMGTDEEAVVDSELRVRGIAGLRVLMLPSCCESHPEIPTRRQS